ncbi:ThuA domain-containing protein [Runella sp. MFBS21]|uniref:ThuA domain-containing protein n=1 Tax=Runella sp. MFBS21 TaxID=3034018 RepID=UPI0023F7D1C2|nr:ThuA domain-containing protein [Runella sp. MFBS21]MDF7821774.1 ThuA domain-containing protein [Runella sp. MFBS21]
MKAIQWIRILAGLAFLGSIPESILAQKRSKIKVLIVDGFSNHDWKQTTAVTKWILEQSGKFVIDVSTVPADSLSLESWNPNFEKYAVVIQNTNNIWNQKLRWSKSAELGLEKYVKNGGGLYILHSGNNAFSHWEEYDKMIGMGWRPKSFGYALMVEINENINRIPPNEGAGTGHGDRFNALITVLNRHPINKNFPKQWQTANTEVYHYPRGSAENLTVLSYAYDSTGTQKMWPVEWVVNYGKGRVYNSSMGHLWRGEKYPPAYRCVGFQTTMIRAAEWLATKKVSYRVPNDFPTKDTISLKPESEYPSN